MAIPAPKRQKTSIFDSNNIYSSATSNDNYDSNSYPFNYPHRARSSYESSETNSSNCLSILHLNIASNNNNNNSYKMDELQSLSITSISSMTGILSFLDEQSLNKLQQTSNKMAKITNEYKEKNIENHHLSRSHFHKHWNSGNNGNNGNNDGQYVPVRSSYDINVDNNQHHFSLHTTRNVKPLFNLNSMSIMSIMSNQVTQRGNSNSSCRKFRSFAHTDDNHDEFALNNVELDDDIDINMTMAASFSYKSDDIDTRNYNTSVSNTLSPLSCLHAPLNSNGNNGPSPLSLDNFNSNTNRFISKSNHHSTIIGHRINEYNEDGNEDEDIYDQNRSSSVLDILNDIQEFSL